MFGILYIIFVEFLHIGKGIPHWPVALLMGLVMWEFFNEVTKQGQKSIVNKGGIMRKINFPKYIIVLSSSLSALINLLLNTVIVVIFIILNDAPISWSYLMIPLYIGELYIFALGCAFLLSTIYVKLRDINFVWDIILRGGFYASAILFPMSRIADKNPVVGEVLLLNPVAQSINDARNSILGQESIPSTVSILGPNLILIPFGIVALTVIIGAWYFRRRSPFFAEEV